MAIFCISFRGGLGLAGGWGGGWDGAGVGTGVQTCPTAFITLGIMAGIEIKTVASKCSGECLGWIPSQRREK